MAFCKNCGAEMNEGATFCGACGTPVDQAQAQAQPQAAQAQPVAAPDDVAQNKGIAWLSYFGLLLLIPFFARKDSKFCRFHVKQGIILFLADIAYLIATQILLAIIRLIFPGETYGAFGIYYTVPSPITNIFTIIFNLASIFFLVCAIIGIVNVVKGEEKKLPLLGEITFLDGLVDKMYGNK